MSLLTHGMGFDADGFTRQLASSVMTNHDEYGNDTAVVNTTNITVGNVTDDDMLTDNSNSPEFDPVLFWSVNSIWMTVLAVVVLFFWKCNGAELLTQWSRGSLDSDIARATALQQRRQEELESKRLSPEERLEALKAYFVLHRVCMTVEAGDIVQSLDVSLSGSTSSDSADGSVANHSTGSDVELGMPVDAPSVDTGAGSVLVLRSGSERNIRQVPNCCAVCLGSYHVGDRVAWSSNEQCFHAFHEECVCDWFSKMRDGTPCPCCRQDFTPGLKTEREKPVRWEPGATMELSAIRL